MKITPKLLENAGIFEGYLKEYLESEEELDDVKRDYFECSYDSDERKALEPVYFNALKRNIKAIHDKADYEGYLRACKMYGRVWEYLQDVRGIKYIRSTY